MHVYQFSTNGIFPVFESLLPFYINIQATVGILPLLGFSLKVSGRREKDGEKKKKKKGTVQAFLKIRAVLNHEDYRKS